MVILRYAAEKLVAATRTAMISPDDMDGWGTSLVSAVDACERVLSDLDVDSRENLAAITRLLRASGNDSYGERLARMDPAKLRELKAALFDLTMAVEVAFWGGEK